MARLPLLPGEPDDPVVAEVFEASRREGRAPIALYRALGHAPQVLASYSSLARTLRYDATTDRALREIAILRTARLIGSAYEWAHHVPMARAAGVRDDQIAAVRAWSGSTAFDAREQIVLRCVDELHAHAVSDDAFAALAGELGAEGAVEIVLLASFYQGVARTIQALGLEVEPEYEPHLESW